MELITQDDGYYEKKIIIVAHMPCIITFEFNKFECVCYKQMLI